MPTSSRCLFGIMKMCSLCRLCGIALALCLAWAGPVRLTPSDPRNYRIAESPNRRGANFDRIANREALLRDSARFGQPCTRRRRRWPARAALGSDPQTSILGGLGAFRASRSVGKRPGRWHQRRGEGLYGAQRALDRVWICDACWYRCSVLNCCRITEAPNRSLGGRDRWVAVAGRQRRAQKNTI